MSATFAAGVRVRHNSTGRTGTIVNDLGGMMSVTGPGERLVIYDGTSVGDGTMESDLTIIGKYEAKADVEKCGGGQDEKCCKFLGVGAEGATCLRYSSLHWSLIFKPMTAKREPTAPYPECQIK